MATDTLSAYQVAAVDEHWRPLVGIEIEAMNLDTLLADSVQTTGKDGVASFSGLPAGPHFFRARTLRVSTRVQSTLEPDRGRTFTGMVRLQVIAWAGIVKHAVVDKNGFGTHTTVQAAVNAIVAQAVDGGTYVIHINPGTYAEDVTVTCPAVPGSLFLIIEGQGEQTENGSVHVVYVDSFTATGAVVLSLKQLAVNTAITGVTDGTGTPFLILRQVGQFGIE